MIHDLITRIWNWDLCLFCWSWLRRYPILDLFKWINVVALRHFENFISIIWINKKKSQAIWCVSSISSDENCSSYSAYIITTTLYIFFIFPLMFKLCLICFMMIVLIIALKQFDELLLQPHIIRRKPKSFPQGDMISYLD